MLLSVSADSHAVDSEGRTALDYAGLLDNGADMVALLSSVGGSCGIYVNRTSSTGSPSVLLAPLLVFHVWYIYGRYICIT